jgi:triacylglycerol lipase
MTGQMPSPPTRAPRRVFLLGGLSPRRRILVIGIALVVAAGAVTAAVAATASGGSSGTAPTGFPPQDRPGPVFLVPGYGGLTSSMFPLAARIRSTGRHATVISLPGNGEGDLNADAAVLNAAVDQALSGGAPSVDVIGYSAGSVVVLLWERHDDGSGKARRIVTLGGPFHGAQIAAAGEALVPGACPTACQQLVPGSPLLDGINGTPVPSRPPWLSLWTTDDQTVDPPTSANLAGAVNVPIQSVCPAEQISHGQLPSNPVVMAIVMQAIGPGPVSKPTSAVCRA